MEKREGSDKRVTFAQKAYGAMLEGSKRPVAYRYVADPLSKDRRRRNGRCPCGSGKKYKRCCLRG
jgi:uncharacterized protein YecA (UPF0149 family)